MSSAYVQKNITKAKARNVAECRGRLYSPTRYKPSETLYVCCVWLLWAIDFQRRVCVEDRHEATGFTGRTNYHHVKFTNPTPWEIVYQNTSQLTSQNFYRQDVSPGFLLCFVSLWHWSTHKPWILQIHTNVGTTPWRQCRDSCQFQLAFPVPSESCIPHCTSLYPGIPVYHWFPLVDVRSLPNPAFHFHPALPRTFMLPQSTLCGTK